MPWRRLHDPHNPENRNAGNGGDVVKHVVYLTLLDVLLDRQPWHDELRLRECHAGRAVYRIPDDDPRRLIGAALRSEDNRLIAAQRRALAALSLPDDGSWYVGSSALNATRLAAAPGSHRYEGYEWAPDTRAIAHAVLDEAVGGTLCIALPDADRPDGRFEGEMHVARALPSWNDRDVVLLDPFGLWRRPKLAERRGRYRAIVDAYVAHESAPPLALFFVWSNEEAEEGDVTGDGVFVEDGYGALRERLRDGGREPLVVRWRWDLACAMWVLVPETVERPLRDALDHNLNEVAEIAATSGVGPDLLELS